jgi:hypothetical protein
LPLHDIVSLSFKEAIVSDNRAQVPYGWYQSAAVPVTKVVNRFAHGTTLQKPNGTRAKRLDLLNPDLARML